MAKKGPTKKQQKSPNQETVLGNRKHLKVLFDTNWSYMSRSDQFGIIQSLSPIPQTSFLVGTFFAISYSKQPLKNL